MANRGESERGFTAAAITIGALFFALRGALLAVREPFFDELYTLWIARRPFGGMLEALLHDSGPPLYYALVRILGAGEPSLLLIRLVSLSAGALLLASLLASRSLGPARLIAALLLAVFPPHLYYSTEGRAYALAGLLAGAAALLADRWADAGRRRDLVLASLLLLAAAYSHYYGVFFFAVPLVAAAIPWRRDRLAPALAATAAVAAGFVPGFLLAINQPGEAIGWMRWGRGTLGPLSPLRQLSWAAPYPPSFIEPPPVWLQVAALVLTLAVLAWGLRTVRARRWVAFVAVPLLAVIAFLVGGAGVYFPVRFEAVLAGPLAVAVALSLGTLRARPLRSIVLVAFLLLGLVSSWFTFLTAAARSRDGWREAALRIRHRVPQEVPVVASDYAWLEVWGQTGAGWNPSLTAFPPGQAEHPGWVSRPSERELDLAALPRPPFIWVGDLVSAQRRALESRWKLEPLYRSGRVIVGRVSGDRVDQLEDEHGGQAENEEEADLRPGR